jgi:uncharacterized protein (TIGR00299 family) protein
MTRTAYLDLIGGVAGDMLLAGLIDAGADGPSVFDAVRGLRLDHRAPRVETVVRGGLRALHLAGTPRTKRSTRTLEQILEIVVAGDLPNEVATRAEAVFRRLAAAEARVHGEPLDRVHLHEAGDDDAIFDVVGVCLAIHHLGIDELRCSPVPLGSGQSRKGLPWPGPATLELLRDVMVRGAPPDNEATTPTGAALVTTFSTSFGAAPAMRLDRVGYGAGTRDTPGTPNILRILVGEAVAVPGDAVRGIRVIEANIDDLSPQLVADAADALFAAGALDVWQTPIQMKRGRLAVTLSALTPAEAAATVRATFFEMSTTLGIREYAVERTVLERTFRTVVVRGERVRIKEGLVGDRVVTSMPEHADLQDLAQRTHVPVRRLWREAIEAAARPTSPIHGNVATDARRERAEGLPRA